MDNNNKINDITEYISEAVRRYKARTGASRFTPKAALIDMDGTLYDSMRNHARAWHRMVSEQGMACTEEEFFLVEGMTGAETINDIMLRERGREATANERRDLYAIKARYFNELPRPEAMPGAARMLRTLEERGVKRVLVTGSGQSSLLNRLENDFPGAFLPGMRITSADVTRCKPHPEPYLRGMALAGTEPRQTMVIENAPLGVKSGHDAGAFTVAVTTGPIPREEMEKAGADIIFPSMEAFADALPQLLEQSVR